MSEGKLQSRLHWKAWDCDMYEHLTACSPSDGTTSLSHGPRWANIRSASNSSKHSNSLKRRTFRSKSALNSPHWKLTSVKTQGHNGKQGSNGGWSQQDSSWRSAVYTLTYSKAVSSASSDYCPSTVPQWSRSNRMSMLLFRPLRLCSLSMLQ